MATIRKFKVFNIEWDVDDVKEYKYLPDTMYVNVTTDDVDDILSEEVISNYISEQITKETGHTHFWFNIRELYF